uniref:Uncharacterized protein n=1 Tax=Anopheles atroparvus TaxID=41427 RepID=A0A182IL38_ANOAO
MCTFGFRKLRYTSGSLEPVAVTITSQSRQQSSTVSHTNTEKLLPDRLQLGRPGGCAVPQANRVNAGQGWLRAHEPDRVHHPLKTAAHDPELDGGGRGRWPQKQVIGGDERCRGRAHTGQKVRLDDRRQLAGRAIEHEHFPVDRGQSDGSVLAETGDQLAGQRRGALRRVARHLINPTSIGLHEGTGRLRAGRMLAGTGGRFAGLIRHGHESLLECEPRLVPVEQLLHLILVDKHWPRAGLQANDESFSAPSFPLLSLVAGDAVGDGAFAGAFSEPVAIVRLVTLSTPDDEDVLRRLAKRLSMLIARRYSVSSRVSSQSVRLSRCNAKQLSYDRCTPPALAAADPVEADVVMGAAGRLALPLVSLSIERERLHSIAFLNSCIWFFSDLVFVHETLIFLLDGGRSAIRCSARRRSVRAVAVSCSAVSMRFSSSLRLARFSWSRLASDDSSSRSSRIVFWAFLNESCACDSRLRAWLSSPCSFSSESLCRFS